MDMELIIQWVEDNWDATEFFWNSVHNIIYHDSSNEETARNLKSYAEGYFDDEAPENCKESEPYRLRAAKLYSLVTPGITEEAAYRILLNQKQ